MTVTIGGLVDKINTKITTGGLSDTELLEIAAASKAISKASSRCSSVPTTNCLPLASENKGRLVYVEDCGGFKFSNGTSWSNSFSSTYSSSRQLWMWGTSGYSTVPSTVCSPASVFGGGTTWCAIPDTFAKTMGAIKTDGTLWTWGYGGGDACFALGDGSANTRSSPDTVYGGGTTWCTIGIGVRSASMGAIKTDGTLWTWGKNECGALGLGDTANRSSPTQITGTTWKCVAMSCRGGTALKTDGTVWSWGYGTQGQLGCGANGTVSSPVQEVFGGTTWCSIARSNYSGHGVKTDGTLWSWGSGFNGALGTGNSTNRASPVTPCGGGTTWCKVVTGIQNTMGLKTDGTLWSWGKNFYGELGRGNIGTQYSPGTVLGGGTTWCFASSSHKHGFGIKTNGTLWGWGQGWGGAVGDGSSYDRFSPVSVVGGITSWTRVAAGTSNTAGLTVQLCGFNPAA